MEKRPITTDESKDGELVPDNQNAIEPAIEAILEAVPEDKKTEVIKAISIVQQEVFSGPIPHPRLLAEYERLLPGSMDRFMTMAEKQQDHRMKLEDKDLESQLKSNERGQIFGFILSALIYCYRYRVVCNWNASVRYLCYRCFGCGVSIPVRKGEITH